MPAIWCWCDIDMAGSCPDIIAGLIAWTCPDIIAGLIGAPIGAICIGPGAIMPDEGAMLDIGPCPIMAVAAIAGGCERTGADVTGAN